MLFRSLCNSGKVDGFTYTYTDASGKVFLVRKNFEFIKSGDVPKAVKTGGYFDIPGNNNPSLPAGLFFVGLLAAALVKLRRTVISKASN